MSYGYLGKILRADLSTGKLTIEEFPQNFYRTYFGGEGFVCYFLLREVPQNADPLGPENKLIVAAGPLTGAPVGGCGRHSIGAKSPLTGGFGEADAGGYWGAELKFSGLDAIIIEGKAEKPVYIFIQDGQASIRDAQHLWGMKTLECQNAIREELADSDIKVLQIGPGGENLVRFACIMNDLDAAAGRTGMGAVMGSKKLKAIACRGHQRLSLADPRGVRDIARWIKENSPVNRKNTRDLGTAFGVGVWNDLGGLPTKNFQDGYFDGADKISGETMRDTIFINRRSCFACAVQCKREVKVEEPYTVDPKYGGPEYETIGAIGSACGIDDLKAIAKGNELLNAYGLDSISCGVTIAFAMECFENNLLTLQDTGGLKLRFGNADAMLEMIEQIAMCKGLGAVLSEGSARAAQKIGAGAEKFAMHIKGQELSMHEPRLKPGMGIGFSMSPTGADHCHNIHDTAFTSQNAMMDQMKELGILEPIPLKDLSPAKMRLLIYNSMWQHFLNSATCCQFVMYFAGAGFERVAQLVQSVTGWNTNVFELMKIGERVMNLSRAFNVREGFTSKDDNMPQRIFTAHISGRVKHEGLDPEVFEKAKETYYDMMGWPNGSPSSGKLGELGIEWVESLLP